MSEKLFNIALLEKQFECPRDWISQKNKFLFRQVSEKGHENLELLSVYREYGVIPKASRDDNFNRPSEDLSNYKRVKKGYLTINKMKAWQGSLGISDYEGIVSPAYFTCEPIHNSCERYLHYQYRNYYYTAKLASISKGIRPNQWDLPYDDFSDLRTFIPSIDEQQAIADFLDKKTALIDSLVEKKKRQIELLTEQRQAVINQAVTKGLNPNVEMKDSGIEWLGEIPKHWDVKKTKLLCSQIGDGIHTTPKYVDTSNIYFINGNNLIDGQIQIQESTKCVDEDEYLKHKIELKKGTILLSINGTIGNQAFYNGEEVILGKSAAYMECEDELDNCFFSYVLKTHYIYNFFEQSLSGTTIKNLSLYTLNNTPVVLPNNEEQKEIVEHLNCAVREINLTISKAEKQIELLQEYRTALISEAVTGKIDVRNAV